MEVESKGNINKTYLSEDKEFGEVFCKLVSNPNRSIYEFQNLLARVVGGKFNVNKYLCTNIKSNNEFELVFEKIENKTWVINEESMYIIGKSMAVLHRLAKEEQSNIHIPIKNEKYDSMEKWNFIANSTLSQPAFKLRREIFKQLKPFNLNQPKIPVHRDFKPHNIMFDGSKYWLIDFDFAAVDFACLEVMSFVVDIIGTNHNNIKAFIKGYKTIDNGIDFKTMVNDYLVYLCVNTFPFYMKDSLSETGFKNLLNNRNNSLSDLWSIKETINNILNDESN